MGRLGFKVRFEATEDGKNGIMGLERGSIELTIDCPMSGHGRNACASLVVNSADAYYEEWGAEGRVPAPAYERGVGCTNLRLSGSVWELDLHHRSER